MFIAGDHVYLRHLQRDRLAALFPLRVVYDRSDGLLLWAPAGTTGWHFNMPDGRGLAETPLREWMAAHRVPVPYSIAHGLLSWHPRGRDYSIRWFFRPDGQFIRWYANLEQPAVAWRDDGIAGIDTVDWDLDVVIGPDRHWEWKDEDEFAARLEVPEAYWVDDEERVRRAGKEVIGLVESGVFPFDGTWCDFRPDPAWTMMAPSLPPGWDRPTPGWAGA